VGLDDLGKEAIATLSMREVDPGLVEVDTHHSTGTVDVTLDASGVATYAINRPVAWDFIAITDSLLSAASLADAVCFGTLAQRSSMSHETIQTVLTHVKSACLRVLDVNLRAPFYSAEIVRDSLALCDLLKLNDEELPIVTDLLGLPSDPSEAMQALFDDHGVRIIALTKGKDGSAIYTRDETHELPGESIEVVDTVGAGDAFTAALIAGLLAGRDLGDVHTAAAHLAAAVCTHAGATPDLSPGLIQPIH
jgi:fructokinase